ncbi:MAG: hypothetical protein ABFS45_20410 [Pseudomonadota bacterium]
MNITTIKPIVLSSILGLVMSGVVATTAVNAAESILNDAIHDYSDDAWGSFADTATYDRGGYQTSIVLDESYHDYVSEDVALFNGTSDKMEQAEFAAFEKAVRRPWEVSSERDW